MIEFTYEGGRKDREKQAQADVPKDWLQILDDFIEELGKEKDHGNYSTTG